MSRIGATATHRPRTGDRRVGAALALALVTAAPTGLRAQQPPSIVEGAVTDAQTSAAIEGATVVIVGTPSSATTNHEGRYQLPLPPGQPLVTVRVFALGFAVEEAELSVAPGESLVFDFALSGAGLQAGPSLGPPLPGDTLDTVELDLLFPEDRRRAHAQLTFRLFDTRGSDPVELRLFDTLTVVLEAEHVEEVRDGHVRWIGRVTGPPRHAGARAYLVIRDGLLTANIRLDELLFHVRPQREGIHTAIEVLRTPRENGEPDDPGSEPPGPDPPSAPGNAPGASPYMMPPWASAMPVDYVIAGYSADACTDFENLKSGPFPEIRLLVLYTTAVAAGGGVIADDIDLWILEGNDALEESGIRQRLALSHIEELETDETVGIVTMGKHLQDPTDGIWDHVHDLRDEYFADAVILITQDKCCGKSFTLQNVTMQHADSAFAVVHRASANDQLTFIHELGHIMGAQHERPTSHVMEPYGYNHGYEFGSFGTIMATATRILRFSNPARPWAGNQTGIPSGQPDAADNARAIQNVGALVSAFRLSPVWFVAAGGSSPWLEKRVATEQRIDLRFGDFDGDGETDVFKSDESTGTWWWSRSGSEPWAVLNPANPDRMVPITHLGFGDFDGNDTTDVFYSTRVTTGSSTQGVWFWSKNGRSDWETLNGPADDLLIGVWDLAFGDFDGNGTTDVFRSDKTVGQWYWSDGGTEDWDTLNGPDATFAIDVSDLGFADFDGDGKTDVFASAGGVWRYSSAGSDPWSELSSKGDARSTLAFGDFDGNGEDDVFKADGKNWWISWGGTKPWEGLMQSCYELRHLSFGDFDGDGTTDVFRNGRRP